jgi:peptide/nickel transport system substrate-binding protein
MDSQYTLHAHSSQADGRFVISTISGYQWVWYDMHGQMSMDTVPNYLKVPENLFPASFQLGDTWSGTAWYGGEVYTGTTTAVTSTATVFAGGHTYTNCLQIRTVITGPHPFGTGTRDAWFAPNVGLVKIAYNRDDGSVTTVELQMGPHPYTVFLPFVAVGGISKYNEPSMLQELVDAGILPPVEERLPKAPQVVEPVQYGGTRYGSDAGHGSAPAKAQDTARTGQYGGTWHATTWGPDMGNIKMILYDPPIRWKPDYSGYEPGLAKSWEWSEDGMTVTLHFREGVKWSDGEPFTMDDLEFWWEDLATNDEYGMISVPWWGYDANGDRMEVSFPDDYTMVMHWETPQWVAPFILAQGFWEWESLMKPKHYLQQFHPGYSPGSDWETFEEMDKWWENPDYPVLLAWHTVAYTAEEKTVLERNPYYWKVDTEGNQLPYIDRIEVEIVPDPGERLQRMANGDYDASFRGSGSPKDIPFLQEHAEAGGYHLEPGWTDGAGAWPGWIINQDYHEELDYDPVTESEEAKEIRALLRNPEFRRGLSHALDRQRLISNVWGGNGTPKQFTISPQSWHFTSDEGQQVFEDWEQAYAEHNPGEAQTLWNEIGFVDQDSDGWRDLPSGKPFTLTIDQNDWGGADVTIPANEIFKEDLEALGIRVLITDVIGLPAGNTRGNHGLFMLRNTHAAELDLWTYPDWVFPLRGGGEGSRAFPMQGLWYQTGGAEGWAPEPGSPAARLQALYRQGIATPYPEQRHRIVWDAVQIHIDEGPFVLGASGDQPRPVVVKGNFHNVPEYGILGPWAPGSPGNTHPELYWIEQ